MPPTMEDAWRRFKVTKDPKAREAIIENYSYLVKITAGRVVANLPPNLEREDLYTAGAMGLIKAVDQFDPDRRVKFETYAIALIRGAILESLREEDWVPRSVRERAKTLERTFHYLETQNGVPANEQQVADHLGIGLDDLGKIMADAGRTSVMSLDDLLLGGGSGGEGGENLHLADVLPDDQSDTAGGAELRARIHELGKAIDRLPDRERLVIALYYL